jgi:hypothetical protein
LLSKCDGWDRGAVWSDASKTERIAMRAFIVLLTIAASNISNNRHGCRLVTQFVSGVEMVARSKVAYQQIPARRSATVLLRKCKRVLVTRLSDRLLSRALSNYAGLD